MPSPGWTTRLLSRYWLLLPMLIVVVIAVDRIESPADIDVEETIDMRETRSDYYLAEFRSRKFGSDGQVEYTVEGETLAHYPLSDRSEIKAPRMELLRAGTVWQIESDSGLFDTDPDRFTLSGSVIIQRRADNTSPVTILTSTLTVATESNQVATDAPIEINANTWRLQAVGLKSAIDDGKLSLLSEVVGRYEVPVR